MSGVTGCCRAYRRLAGGWIEAHSPVGIVAGTHATLASCRECVQRCLGLSDERTKMVVVLGRGPAVLRGRAKCRSRV
jgi:hypothetical protein